MPGGYLKIPPENGDASPSERERERERGGGGSGSLEISRVNDDSLCAPFLARNARDCSFERDAVKAEKRLEIIPHQRDEATRLTNDETRSRQRGASACRFSADVDAVSIVFGRGGSVFLVARAIPAAYLESRSHSIPVRERPPPERA